MYLRRHIEISHTGIKQPPKKQPRKKYVPKIKIFQCQICSKILSTKSILERHVSDHHKTIKCKFCQKLFGTQLRLKDHVRDCHENLREHNCEICSRRFKRRSKLKSDINTHDPNCPRDLKCTQ